MVTAVSAPAVATLGKGSSIAPGHTPRLASVDVLRGLVMVIMALDHTRDFLTSARTAPEDLAHTSGALFFTRFITHFCAPVFAFLAGTGAFLATRRGKSIPQVSQFFLTRGLWLLFLEFTIVDFAWGFVPWAHGGVIWILGWSMVAMALIVRLPVRWIAALGLGIIATHNLLDSIDPLSFGRFYWSWMLLHTPGPIPITANFSFSVRYVLIPWVGVMAAGFAFGSLLHRPDRRKWILRIGISATLLFFVLRGINLYGNGTAGLPFGYPRSAGSWSVQPSFSLTVVSFFNTLKYPPSLDYLLMTLGPSMILLGLLDGAKAERGLSRILMVFGRVPLFYYVLHIYLIHLIAIVVALASHQPVWHGTVIADFAQKPSGYGHGLPFIYAMWVLAVAILYVPCRWFMEFRSRHRDWGWLSYL
ncbi:MAG TPA: heparan-alpha-glucosaminide N-acetyltransferase domain-containing protein [Candidatus Sulfotelmatobacter sp.]|nr:heparan-alpha-glucosaminide N-acetyltransferase domain-containing protein [Candidatus Sulfotelmatobacter sp.]